MTDGEVSYIALHKNKTMSSSI